MSYKTKSFKRSEGKQVSWLDMIGIICPFASHEDSDQRKPKWPNKARPLLCSYKMLKILPWREKQFAILTCWQGMHLSLSLTLTVSNVEQSTSDNTFNSSVITSMYSLQWFTISPFYLRLKSVLCMYNFINYVPSITGHSKRKDIN